MMGSKVEPAFKILPRQGEVASKASEGEVSSALSN